MFRKMRKFTAMLLTVLMLVSMLPVDALALIYASDASSGVSPSQIAPLNIVEPDDGEYFATYTFYNGEKVVDTQIVAVGETVSEPATPTVPDGQKFEGWYVDGAELDFTTPVADLTEDTDVRVDARFSDVYYVFFLTTDGDVYRTLEATKDKGYKVTPPADYVPDGDLAVTGWVVEDTETPFTAETPVTGDTYVTPETAECYWVTFDTQGGTPVDSAYVTHGQSINLNNYSPTRTGYTFQHWSDEPDGARVSNYTNFAPTASTTLYAVWEGDEVRYTVVYWGENADDKGYSPLYTVESNTAQAGTVISPSDFVELPQWTTDREHFTYDADNAGNVDVTINADGSSVLNVYFSRNEYTLTFRANSGSIWRPNWQTVATITAKYGAYIADEFEKAPFNTTYDGRAWEDTGRTYDYALQTLDRMPGTDVTFELYSKSSDRLKTIYYYVEKVGVNAGNSWPNQSNDNYELLKTVNTYFNYATYEEEYHEIQGFTRFSSSEAGFRNNEKNFDRNNRLYLYYLRNSYDLTFINYGDTVEEEPVDYQAPLSDYASYVPPRPEGFSVNARFVGWYTVQPDYVTENTQPFNFESEKMPAGDLILYAYWEENPVTVTVHVQVEGQDPITAEIPVGDTIASSDAYERAMAYIEGNDTLHFLRWVDAQGNRVDVNQPLSADAEIFAVYRGVTYTVTYAPGLGEGDAFEDSNKYIYQAKAKVSAFPEDSFDAPEGMEFAYWTDKKGNIYYPGQSLTIGMANVTLTANYVVPSQKYTVTYHANFEGDNDATYKVDQVANNQKITILDYDEIDDLPKRTGYTFQGWSTSPDATTAIFSAGSTARVSGDGNDLYAVWQQNRYTVTYNKGNYGTLEDQDASGNVVTENLTYPRRPRRNPQRRLLLHRLDSDPRGNGHRRRHLHRAVRCEERDHPHRQYGHGAV